MVDTVIRENRCCGCGACFHICPRDAISIAENEDGFITATIDVAKCINCGICDKVCPIRHQETKKALRCWALKIANKQELMETQSGGAFYCIAKTILLEGGVCYGVSNSDIYNVCTVRADSEARLKELLKSKYVQADVLQSFLSVEKDLGEGKLVFYSGTACVIQGLKNYLRQRKIPQEKLITCDLVCHGVPSRAIDRDYIGYIERKKGAKLSNVIYRDKEKNWGSHFEKYIFANGDALHSNDKVIVFSKGYSLSPACFFCEFATPYRESDITIGDFWTLERVGMSRAQHKDGMSVCLVRNNWINGILEKLAQNKVIELSEIELNEAMQWNLKEPTTRPADYEEFWKMYRRNRFRSLKPVYFSLSMKQKFARMARKLSKKR